ncbi:hypothetical protein [Burkholderia gladioli]|uniref:hypothetical protein n=1 Tax=Burkholderia gladioli TaxID=28095 RepID=UPI001640F3E4|nr:hypothetical protein [Burkholderia gladioli]
MLIALFDELARRVRADAACDCRLARLTSQGEALPVTGQRSLALRGALRAFLHAHCLASGAAEPRRMTDALMLVWQGRYRRAGSTRRWRCFATGCPPWWTT